MYVSRSVTQCERASPRSEKRTIPGLVLRWLFVRVRWVSLLAPVLLLLLPPLCARRVRARVSASECEPESCTLQRATAAAPISMSLLMNRSFGQLQAWRQTLRNNLFCRLRMRYVAHLAINRSRTHKQYRHLRVPVSYRVPRCTSHTSLHGA